MPENPGLVILFGSGETSASGRKVFDWLLSRLEQPIRVSVLETPAGFELNSAQVAGRVADFVAHRLQNYDPQVMVVPARKRGTPFSPDDPDILSPLLESNVIFLGPGSPTYAVRQLQDSVALHTLVARHRLGCALVLASAATVAAGAHTLPVYEIYKVGDELHWVDGLDLFGPYGLSLVFIPHWNNAEGGTELDTSRCYMGRARFEPLMDMLPSDTTVVGIDEHTALVMDVGSATCRVMGKGGVTVLKDGTKQRIEQNQTFDLAQLDSFRPLEASEGVPPDVWQRVRAAQLEAERAAAPELPHDVLTLVEAREAARARRDWSAADALRDEIASLGWQVSDTSQGPALEFVEAPPG